jgi:RNA polymerase-interacting CarD/CdnL/TRCF family regulator
MATEGQEIQIGDGSLHIGDRVVYPNQGICRITGVETKEIAGRNWEVVTLSREEDGATVMVPRAKVMTIGLRKVATVADIEKVFDYFALPGDDPQLDWKVRHRENADRMTGGGLFGTVEVLKGLHALSRVRPLPQKERELYDSARHLMVGEIAAALNIPPATAEDHLDYALWPPPGMTRKGKKLETATIGMALKPRGAGEMDDELGFEDEQGEEAEEKEEKEQEEAEVEEGGEEEGPKAKPAKAPKAAPPPKPPKAAAPPSSPPPAPVAIAPAPEAPRPLAHHEPPLAVAAQKLKEAVVHAGQKMKDAMVHAAAKALKEPEPKAHAHEPAHKVEAHKAEAKKPAAKPPLPAPKKEEKPAAKAKAPAKPAKAEPKKAAPKPVAKVAPKKAAPKPVAKAAAKKGKR